VFTRISGVLVLAIAAAVAADASAQSAAEFYKGRQVVHIVGYGPGGGYDVYGRLVSRHMAKHIPGEPSVVVQNMPGAGSLRAVNYLYNTAPKDGSTFGNFAGAMPLLGVLGHNKSAKFDPLQFTWLGTPSSGVNDPYLMFGRRDAPVKKIEDAIGPNGKELLLGNTGEGSSGAQWAMVLRETMALKLRLVSGYPDSAAIFLAVERGEVQGRSLDYSAVRSSRPQWLTKDSPIQVLLQFGLGRRHKDFPDVPTAREFVKGDKATQLLEVAELSNSLSRPFAAPPGVPPDRAKVLQDAFMAATTSAEYKADAEKVRVDVSPIDGNEFLQRVKKLAAAPPEVLEVMRMLTAKKPKKK
jgi:tripartite-type tricarboxylate transporter receptor subunit TctC